MKKCRWQIPSFFIGLVPLLVIHVAEARDDALTRMFEWWNEAFKTPSAFTEQAFREHFTDDAVLIVDGVESAKGITELATHFQRIQANSESVRIVLPFAESFSSGDRIFTYHFVHRRRDGEESCMRAMGYAVMKNEKIALIDLVRVLHVPEKSVGPGCDVGD